MTGKQFGRIFSDVFPLFGEGTNMEDYVSGIFTVKSSSNWDRCSE